MIRTFMLSNTNREQLKKNTSEKSFLQTLLSYEDIALNASICGHLKNLSSLPYILCLTMNGRIVTSQYSASENRLTVASI